MLFIMNRFFHFGRLIALTGYAISAQAAAVPRATALAASPACFDNFPDIFAIMGILVAMILTFLVGLICLIVGLVIRLPWLWILGLALFGAVLLLLLIVFLVG